ncbi:MAG: hypothetical protein A3G20_03215 [Acidobacteria bacterium RIFCSPLOWO2_12_FULL_59_11]|nr:MAG: hypothetical protein A3G20_03215 [Acidobacteria bacterium RIFCSPLOWO2_12_FULL_59_11]
MSNVENIETRIKELSPEELTAFREWFIKFDAEAWDREIEADSQEGRLDFLVGEAREEKAKGTLKDL